MAIAPLPPIGATPPASGAAPAAKPAAPGFAEAIGKGIDQVSSLEQQADAVTEQLATGGPAGIHDLMAATAKAQMGVELLVQVRNRAVEAYQEIMRLQV